MTDERAIEILKLYKQKLEESVSTELGNDIQAFEMAINALSEHLNTENNDNSAKINDKMQDSAIKVDLISKQDVLDLPRIKYEPIKGYGIIEYIFVDDIKKLPTYSAKEDTEVNATKTLENAIEELSFAIKHSNNELEKDHYQRALNLLTTYAVKEDTAKTEMKSEKVKLKSEKVKSKSEIISVSTVDSEISGAENEPYFKKPDDLISKQEVLDVFKDVHPLDYNAQSYFSQIKKLKSYSATVDIGEITAEWIYRGKFTVCSNCGEKIPYGIHNYYCRNCGAKMKGYKE